MLNHLLKQLKKENIVLTSYSSLDKGVRRYVQAFAGNRFEACKAVSNDAVAIMHEAGGCISESEAIACALTGQYPDNLAKRKKQHMNLSVPKTEYMINLLSYVDDDSILESVKESYAESTRINSLTFYYVAGLSKEEKSRVRVLTRMCWFNR